MNSVEVRRQMLCQHTLVDAFVVSAVARIRSRLAAVSCVRLYDSLWLCRVKPLNVLAPLFHFMGLFPCSPFPSPSLLSSPCRAFLPSFSCSWRLPPRLSRAAWQQRPITPPLPRPHPRPPSSPRPRCVSNAACDERRSCRAVRAGFCRRSSVPRLFACLTCRRASPAFPRSPPRPRLRPPTSPSRRCVSDRFAQAALVSLAWLAQSWPKLCSQQRRALALASRAACVLTRGQRGSSAAYGLQQASASPFFSR